LFYTGPWYYPEKQESRAVASKPRDAAVVLFGLKFADSIHYKFKSSQALKARLQTIPAQNRISRKTAIQSDSRLRVLESVERRYK